MSKASTFHDSGTLERVAWTQDDIRHMTNDELLEAIWDVESLYGKREDYSDHRRHLARSDLENVFFLSQRRAQLRLSNQPFQP